MATSFGGSPSTSTTAGVLSAGRTALYLLTLRFFGGLSMIYFQGWDQAVRAYRHLWAGKPWALVTDMEARGFPTPAVLATALIFVLLSASVAILAGFLTRINATLLLVCTLFILLSGLLGQYLTPQTSVIYGGLFAALIMSGPGLVSLDALLTRRRAQKRGF